VRPIAFATLLGFSLTLGAGAPAFAQQAQQMRPIGAPIRPPIGAPVAAPALAGPTHTVVGTITQIGGPILTVMLRTRRPLHVDASAAIARGSYSAPLFVGKYVVLQGRYGRDGTLFATTITRLPRLDSTILDR
jgi:hypothetical protein